MTFPPLKHLRFHPFFRVALVQRMRRGEAEAVARLAAREVEKVIAARRRRGSDVDDAGAEPGIVMVPLRKRVKSIEQLLAREEHTYTKRAKDRNHDRER